MNDFNFTEWLIQVLTVFGVTLLLILLLGNL